MREGGWSGRSFQFGLSWPSCLVLPMPSAASSHAWPIPPPPSPAAAAQTPNPQTHNIKPPHPHRHPNPLSHSPHKPHLPANSPSPNTDLITAPSTRPTNTRPPSFSASGTHKVFLHIHHCITPPLRHSVILLPRHAVTTKTYLYPSSTTRKEEKGHTISSSCRPRRRHRCGYIYCILYVHIYRLLGWMKGCIVRIQRTGGCQDKISRIRHFNELSSITTHLSLPMHLRPPHML